MFKEAYKSQNALRCEALHCPLVPGARVIIGERLRTGVKFTCNFGLALGTKAFSKLGSHHLSRMQCPRILKTGVQNIRKEEEELSTLLSNYGFIHYQETIGFGVTFLC